MKKILFITPQLPFPATSGGLIKTFKLLEYFACRYEIQLCCFLKVNDTSSVSLLSDSLGISNILAIPFQRHRNFSNYLQSFFHKVPLSVFRNKSSKMFEYIESASKHVDAIFIDHFLMAQYIPKNFKGQVVLHQHNAEYVMWERCAYFEKNLLRKFAVYIESKRIRQFERKVCKDCDAILAAPNDIQALSQLGISKNKFFRTLHLGNEELINLPDVLFHDTDLSLLVIGSLDWEANRDGLLWFLREVWPRLSVKFSNLSFDIIGRNPGSELQSEVSKHDGVKLHGFVDDLDHYYSNSRVFLAPLRFGSGIKVKVINALYRGIPIATTSVGAEGLSVISGKEMFISNDAEIMANQITTLLTNEECWNNIRDNSRSLARNEYTWDATLKTASQALNF